jgi:hypothetical protein
MIKSGYDAAATKVRIRLESVHTQFGDYSKSRKAGRYFLFHTIRYGYQPWRAVQILIVLVGISAYAFWIAPNGQIEPTKEATELKLEFSPIFYAFDSLMPFVDLHQRNRWLVRAPNWELVVHSLTGEKSATDDLPVGRLVALKALGARALGIIDPLIGWVLTGLFVGGLTGLVRKTV